MKTKTTVQNLKTNSPNVKSLSKQELHSIRGGTEDSGHTLPPLKNIASEFVESNN